MAWRLLWKYRKVLAVAALTCFFISLYVGSSSMPSTASLNNSGRGKFIATSLPVLVADPSKREFSSFLIPNNIEEVNSEHHLGVIVPYRDRFEELVAFVPFIHRYLFHKKISHEIFVVNQIDNYRFNRAGLINAGFLYATSPDRTDGKPCDYIVMHDVDLLPLNNDLPYEFPGEGSVMHVAAPGLHPKYNYPTFIGGILLVTVVDFMKVNGMSNVYWGWGREDDEFYVRLKHGQIAVKRPEGVTTNQLTTFRHTHSDKDRPRDIVKCYDQLNKTKKRDRQTGLNNLNYTLVSTSHLTIDGAPFVLLNVRLECDKTISPWCDCSNASTDKNTQANRNTKTQTKSKSKSVNGKARKET